MNFLFMPCELEDNCRRISQRISMANFDSEFFGLIFPGFQAPPKNSRPEFTPRILSIPLQFHFLEPIFFVHADFLLTKKSGVANPWLVTGVSWALRA